MRFWVLISLGVLVGVGVAKEAGGEMKVDSVSEAAEMKAGVRVEGGEKFFETKEFGIDAEEIEKPGAILFVEEAMREKVQGGLEKIFDVPFGVSSDKELAERLKTPFPGVYYKPMSGESLKKRVHGEDGEVIARELRAARRIADIPLFQEVTEENFGLYKEAGLPIAYFIDKLASLDKHEWVKAISAKNRDIIKIALLDSVKSDPFLEGVGITKEKRPALAIFDESMNKYVLTNLSEERAAELSLFLERYLKGEEQPFLMSEDEPETGENEKNAVFKLVGKSFEKYTKDLARDVLVVFHAPWCGYCKKLMPELKKLGDAVKRDGLSEKILIAEMDMTLNDENSQKIMSYPTVKLFRGGDNEEVLYDAGSARTAEALAAFIKEKGSNKVEISVKELVLKEDL
jgi:thiol-disulfide isomerase/thioredoxin